uniref:Rho-GAP domain-containing protein n=1 Tax=Rhabditophanes sp. KR3021 TaxID=114890 RepID=A0AC35U529_9BILA
MTTPLLLLLVILFDMTVVGYSMVICGYDSLHHRYRDRIEKVKFGVPLSVAFATDIPATLLVLLLKVNKEGPLKKDIWRAPGNQAQVRKLAHTMQHGRLVNISEISVYTAASVIKKFLSKLPGGIFGPENEKLLFGIIHESDPEKQRQIFCNIVCKMSLPSQHLLILLFGTFRIIADSSETFGTRMTSDAIGISVAPSLFHSCIHDARAKFEDVMRFKQASSVVSTLITGFGCTNMFSRDCYEFYARITGRTLRVDENWLFSFQFPTNKLTGRRNIFSAPNSTLSLIKNGDILNKNCVITNSGAENYSATSLVLSRSMVGAASSMICLDPHHQPHCTCVSAVQPLSQIFGKTHPPDNCASSSLNLFTKSQSSIVPLKQCQNIRTSVSAANFHVKN